MDESEYAIYDGYHYLRITAEMRKSIYRSMSRGEELKAELDKWVIENDITMEVCFYDESNSYDFKFESVEDAMAFKLRWC